MKRIGLDAAGTIVPSTPALQSASTDAERPMGQVGLPPAARRTTPGAMVIQSALPPRLLPLADAMSAHWDFLYKRADPSAVESKDEKARFTVRRTEVNGLGVAKALEALEAKGHQAGTGKVLVFGGGYEVDLAPLLERFAEVHVVDLSPAPLRLVDRRHKDSPHRHKLRLVQADASGIPVAHQARVMERHKGQALTAETAAADFDGFPGKLQQLPFGKGEYTLVVSPVLHESLPYGAQTQVHEAARQARSKASGATEARQPLDSVLGEDFFYRPSVMQAFAQVFLHHSAELRRVLAPGGVAVFSSWMREDEQQAARAPGREPLLRVGDTRASRGTWDAFFRPWARSQPLHQERIYGGDSKPTMNVFLLERD